MAKSLILLYGGRSAEREVSVLSAESVMGYQLWSIFCKNILHHERGYFIKTQEFESKASSWWKADDQCHSGHVSKIKPSDVTKLEPWTPMGEDGSIQGFLEVLKMPYVGCILSSIQLKSRPSEFWNQQVLLKYLM